MNQGQIIETQENYERPGTTNQKQGITNKNQDKPQKPKETMKRKKQNSRKTLKTDLKLCGIMKTNHKPL